jgi:hypothetical protein
VIIKWSMNKYGVRISTRLIRFNIGSCNGLCDHVNEPSGMKEEDSSLFRSEVISASRLTSLSEAHYLNSIE